MYLLSGHAHVISIFCCCVLVQCFLHLSLLCRRNEELDDKIVIKRLKKRVAELEAELDARKAGKYSQVR